MVQKGRRGRPPKVVSHVPLHSHTVHKLMWPLAPRQSGEEEKTVSDAIHCDSKPPMSRTSTMSMNTPAISQVMGQPHRLGLMRIVRPVAPGCQLSNPEILIRNNPCLDKIPPTA